MHLSRGASTDRLHTLYVRRLQTFTEHTLPYHSGRSADPQLVRPVSLHGTFAGWSKLRHRCKRLLRIMATPLHLESRALMGCTCAIQYRKRM